MLHNHLEWILSRPQRLNTSACKHRVADLLALADTGCQATLRAVKAGTVQV